jgi:Saxitoxin biosynthesis operon protein SxtJ
MYEIPQLDANGLRQFGLTTGTIFAGLFGVLFPYLFERPWPIWPWVVFAVLVAWALAAPATLNPLYKGWMRIGLLLGRVTTPVILTVIFIVTILPGSIALRLFRRDYMRRKFDEAPTYRVISKKPSVANMEKPY